MNNTLYDLNPVTISWKELEKLVLSLDNGFLHHWDWETKARPLNSNSFEQLKKEGWGIKETALPESYNGVCHSDTKKIEVRPNLAPYERDKTILHELVHAWYGLRDGLFYPQEEAVTEFLARKVRANPLLLKAALGAFDVELFIYDRASYQAFHQASAPQQLAFPFYDHHSPKLELLMD